MKNLPPLSGAILISNPRRNMALALTNPNDKRRINKLSRIVMKEGISPAAVVKKWLSEKSLPKRSRSAMFQRDADAKAMLTYVTSGQAPKTSKAARDKYARVKRAVAKEFAKQGEGYGRSTRHFWGKKHSKSYASRATGSHASRYYTHKKKRKGTSKNLFGRGPQPVILMDVDGVRAWDATRKSRRAAGKWGHTFPAGMLEWEKAHNRYARGQGVPFPYGKGGMTSTSRRSAAAKKGWEKRRARKNSSAREMEYLFASHPKWGKQQRRRKSRARKKLLGELQNNPSFRGTGQYLTGYALPIAVGGAAAGAVHAFLNFGPGELGVKINEFTGMVPVVGPAIVDYVPNTFQGLLVGAALGALAPMVGGDGAKYLALTGGAALAGGALMDAYNAVSARMASDPTNGGYIEEELSADEADILGALALDNMGALALDNMGALALDNLGDGMAAEVVPLTAQDYSQATLGDAYYSGADFSLGEGQALLEGEATFTRKFGRPTIRTKRQAGAASHMAGKPGHRWLWLVKMIGWRRTAAIAAQPPRRRLRTLKAVREAAIKGFQRATYLQRAQSVEAATPSIEELVPLTTQAGSPANSANGPCGPVGAAGAGDLLGAAYGDPALFMGA